MFYRPYNETPTSKGPVMKNDKYRTETPADKFQRRFGYTKKQLAAIVVITFATTIAAEYVMRKNK